MIDSCTASRIRRYVWAGTALLLLAMLAPIQQSINYSKMTEDLVDNIIIMPGEFVTNFVIVGFRGIAADLLWVKVDGFWHQGRWFEIMPLIKAITWMQPHFLEPWELGSWHLAYNLYAYAGDSPDKGIYIKEAIRFIKEGIAENRGVYNLWFNLGWIYYNKLGDYDDGIRYFRDAVRYEHPNYIDRLIAHAYRKKGDIESEYRQWQYCLTIFQDDSYHIDIVKKHLKAAENRLKELRKE